MRHVHMLLSLVIPCTFVACNSFAYSQSVDSKPKTPITATSVGTDFPNLDQDPLVGPHLTSATLPPSPNVAGNVRLELQGAGLTAEMKVSVTGDTRVIGNSLLPIQTSSATKANASLTILQQLDLNKTYKVHLFDKSGAEINSVSLDLEFLVQYQSATTLGRNEPTATGDSILQAWKKRQQATRIERQTQADQRLALAKARAAAVQRQSYLLAHPDVQPVTETASSVGSAGSNLVPAANPYCKYDNSTEETYIRVRRSVIDPKEASDSYGRRLGRRFIVFEVTVENDNPSLQYLLHDVSVDLSRLHNLPAGSEQWAFSGQDLIMLRGVPEKGADYDPRNLTFHIARGVGAVAGGVGGLTAESIQDLFGGVTAAYNGPLLTSFIDIFPDHTATQLNRLSDSAFTANTVVAKQSAKTFAIFVPEGLFLTHSEQTAYWKEPTSVFENPGLDFRQADVCVDGTFITEISAITLVSVSYDDPAAVKAGASVAITLTGTNLAAGDTIVDAFGATFPVTSVDSTGSTAHATVKIPQTWMFQTTPPVSVESKKTGQKTPAVPLSTPPVLSSVTFSDPSKAAKSASVTLAVAGQGMIAGDTDLIFNGNEVPLSSVSSDGTTGQATVILPADYDSTKNYPISLKSKTMGVTSRPAPLTITQTK